MPPKGKAAKGKDAKGDPGEVKVMPVPEPPPAPVCLPLSETLFKEHATERCLLLAFADPKGSYKVQARAWTPGESTEKAANAEDWETSKELALPDGKIKLPGRTFHEAKIFSFEQVRLQYRMVLSHPKEIDNQYVANWFSTPSEPVASFVDPPIRLEAELSYDCDVMPAAVLLRWKSSNMEWLRSTMTESGSSKMPSDMDGAFAAWPGLLPMKVQVRWRVVRSLPTVDEALPRHLAQGLHHVSPAIENVTKDASFKVEDEMWRFVYKEALHGVVAVFQVRVGTLYRWSPWSEESPELAVEVPEPAPPGIQGKIELQDGPEEPEASSLLEPPLPEVAIVECIEIRNLTYSAAEAAWLPFTTEGLLSWIEYRITICTLTGPKSHADFDNEGAAAGTIITRDRRDEIIAPLRGLLPNTWYVVRIDARYPHVGKRSFSDAKAISIPFQTPFPDRPPLAPIPWRCDLDLEELENLALEKAKKAMQPQEPGADAEEVKPQVNPPDPEEAEFNWSDHAWCAFRVERGFLESGFAVEFKDSTSGGSDKGAQHFVGWQQVLCTEKLDVPCGDEWDIIRIAVPKGVSETIVCRLADQAVKKNITPSQWAVSSQPVVPHFDPPDICPLRPAPCWVLPTTGSLKFGLRFFLRPGSVDTKDQLEVTAAHASGSWAGVAAGHRFASHMQLRVRAKKIQLTIKESEQEKPFRLIELPPRDLPKPSNWHDCSVKNTSPGHLNSYEEEVMAGIIGWYGVRYDLEASLEDLNFRKLILEGQEVQASIRVGNSHQWSPWTAWTEPQSFEPPVPSPSDMRCLAVPASPTALSVSWSAFERAPGIDCLEYLIRAVPVPVEVTGEGQEEMRSAEAQAVHTVIRFRHEPRKTDDELLNMTGVQRLLDQKDVYPMTRLTAIFKELRNSEAEADKETLLQARLESLLPTTAYNITVAARYPATAGLHMPVAEMQGETNEDCGAIPMQLGPELTVQAYTPGGDAPPAAPRQVSPTDVPSFANVEEAEVQHVVKPGTRAMLLSIEDRPDYVLEYRACAPNYAHFDPEVGSGLREFSGSWPRPNGEDTIWKIVPGVRNIDKGFGEINSKRTQDDKMQAYPEVIVAARLPDFLASGPATREAKIPLPDVVRFRLCAKDRSASHPCGWVGGMSEPVAVAFAPPRRAPKVSRILSDDRWCLSISFELFKKHSPPTTPPRLLGGQDEDDDDDSEDDEEDNKDLAELRRSNQLPMPPKESWSTSELKNMLVGYGHKQVKKVQIRFSLQSGMSALVRRQLEKQVLSRAWQTIPAIDLNANHTFGTKPLCTLEIDASSGLLDGGIYMFQVRVGNGLSWSDWSHTSKALVFQVPAPTPPSAASLSAQKTVTVEVVSSTAARVRWGDFKPATGLSILEYEVKATPEQNSIGQQASLPVSVTFEHRYRGGFIEHEISNLLPFTAYAFCIQARYPRVGSRTWSGQQVSESVVLEAAAAYQDPPTPVAVAEVEGADEVDFPLVGESSASFVILEFPSEEDETLYDIEYAHVLGDELDTSELRTSQSIWQSPTEVTLASPGFEGTGGGRPQPHWRVGLPDIRHFRGNPVKLALLQRVIFRLRARISPEASSSRWWSSLSAPVATGFAAPENSTASLVAAGDRLGLEVQFMLDRRLNDEVEKAGAAELRMQRADLFKALQQERSSEVQRSPSTGPRPTTTTTAAGMVAPGQSSFWPRGFGHAFVTRYQLRVRHALPDEHNEVSDWSSWEVHPHSSIPKELEKWEVGGASTSSHPHSWYKVELPQPKGRGLVAGLTPHGESVQVSIRIGDGIKWSPWKNIKEVTVCVNPPRPVRETDAAVANWYGNACTVSWPSVLGHAGLEYLEYQLMVIPDSAYLVPFVGAVVHAQAGTEDPTKTKAASKKPGKAALNKLASRWGGMGMKIMARVVAGQGTLVAVEDDRADSLALEFKDLCPDIRYAFQVLARYPTVGPRTFNKIFEVGNVHRKPPKHLLDEFDELITPVETPEPKVESSIGPAVLGRLPGPLPPTPVQVPLMTPTGQEKMKRWLQDGSARVVLLTWSGLIPAADNPRTAAAMKVSWDGEIDDFGGRGRFFEIQATEFSKDDSEDMPDEAREWHPCDVATAPFTFEDVPCVVLKALPFFMGKFRLFDPKMLAAGPATAPIVTIYENVSPRPEVEMVALGQGAPRTMAARLKLPLASPQGTGSRATHYQLRFKALGDPNNPWEELAIQMLNNDTSASTYRSSSEPAPAEATVREEDGLELGSVYEFQARLGDRCRLGNWSSSSRPLRFAVPLPVPSQGGGLKVSEGVETAEFSWAPFGPDADLAAKMPGFRQLPIEYTLTVMGGMSEFPVSSLVTRETKLTVGGLQPNTSYSATLLVRWARFAGIGEKGQDTDHMLMAAFVTQGRRPGHMMAELSVRLPTERIEGYGPVSPAVAKFKLKGENESAVTLDLDPYYVPPRLQHYTADFVRKPTLPSSTHASPDGPVEQPEGSAESAEPEGQTSSPDRPNSSRKKGLPTLVPLPPPKFTTRDPISFAMISPAPPSSMKPLARPSPRQKLDRDF